MDTVKRLRLQKCREKIVQDLDVKYLIDGLYSREIISDSEKEDILQERTRKDQVRHLLDILPQKGPEAFDNFLTILRKDYPWLSDELSKTDSQSSQREEEAFLDALLLGGIPRSPPHHIQRKAKLKIVRESLANLRREQYVVLHGMTGSGKSCLAAAAVDSLELVSKTFKNIIFWITFGDNGSDDLLAQMVPLLSKLEYIGKFKSDYDAAQQMNVNWVQYRLKNYFSKPCFREGLLILDDVTQPEVIDKFDVGCKILVTTKDLDVLKKVKHRQHCVVTLNEGFTERETLALFANSINACIDLLPQPQAKNIHNLCKGVPMLIALIGANLEDHINDVRNNLGRWNYIIDMLTKRDSSSSLSHIYQNELIDAIGMSIDNLPDYHKQKFKDFALFVEDVNIKPEVLQTLWSINKYEVEDIMTFFVKKSLAVSKWNEELNSSIYGIHDLILIYLKGNICNDKIALHRKLLNAYNGVCNGDFSKLPNDNYIFSYIGYHITEAEMWDEFYLLFIDLNFIGAKLKVTGPGDLLVDYKKYRSYITRGKEELSKLVDDFERFVQTHGLDLYKYQDLDVVQCALKESRKSHVFEAAFKTAKESNTQLYLEHVLDQDWTPQSYTLPLKDEVFSVCFTGDQNKILIANETGTINLWAIDYKQILYSFHGHIKKVVLLKLNLEATTFLSCSKDNTIKLWNLEDLVYKTTKQEEFDEHGLLVKTPSPRMRQSNWSDMFSESNGIDKSFLTFTGHKEEITYASFSNKGDEVISCSMDSTIKVWNSKTGEIRLNLESFNSSYCSFSCNDSLILFGGTDSLLKIHDSVSGEYLSYLCNNQGRINSILCIPDTEEEVIVVTNKSIILWKWEDMTKDLPSSSDQHHEGLQAALPLQDITSLIIDSIVDAEYICAVLSRDGQYLITAATNFYVFVWDVNSSNPILVKDFHDTNMYIRCLDTACFNGRQQLLAGSEEKTIKIWTIDKVVCENPVKFLANFDALWEINSKETELPWIAVADSTNKVQILYGLDTLGETLREEHKITVCKLSRKKLVAYGCSNGMVKLFDFETGKSKHAMKLEKSVTYLDFLESEHKYVLAAGDESSLKFWSPKNHVQVCGGVTDAVIQCSLMVKSEKILSCFQDASIKVWEVETGTLTQVVSGRISTAQITAADFSSNGEILVMADANYCFHIAALQISNEEPYATLISFKTKKAEDHLNSCRISNDSAFLALGQDNGNIIVWDMEQNREHAVLNIHRSKVGYLLFAEGRNDLLVSVGEVIAWWGLSAVRCRSQSRRSRGSFTLVPPSPGTPAPAPLWRLKVGRTNKPALLGCLKLAGTSAFHLVASPDFTMFTTIDTSGVIYILKVVASDGFLRL